MKPTFFLLLLCCSCTSLVHAESSYTLVQNETGQRYYCSQSGSLPVDERCITTLAEFCGNTTTEPKEWCFEKATIACPQKSKPYKECVINTANFCFENTFETKKWCFETSLSACSGDKSIALLKAIKAGVTSDYYR